jgi:hypothetical protein
MLFSCVLFAAQGTVPLKEAKHYPASITVDGVGIGAAILNPSQVKQRFVTDLGRDFLVVELALFPNNGVDLALDAEKFALRINRQEGALRSENPKVIAAALQQADESGRDIAVIPHVGVGYESGGVRYDPTTGTYRRGGGLYTSTGVAVVVGDPANSPPSRKNEEVMALELTEKGLPAGTFQKPVAGHLYFHAGKDVLKNKRTSFELVCQLNGKESVLPLKR